MYLYVNLDVSQIRIGCRWYLLKDKPYTLWFLDFVLFLFVLFCKKVFMQLILRFFMSVDLIYSIWRIGPLTRPFHLCLSLQSSCRSMIGFQDFVSLSFVPLHVSFSRPFVLLPDVHEMANFTSLLSAFLKFFIRFGILFMYWGINNAVPLKNLNIK